MKTLHLLYCYCYAASTFPRLCSGKVLHHHGRLGTVRQQNPDRALSQPSLRQLQWEKGFTVPLWPQEERVRSPSLHSPGLPDRNSELARAQAPPCCAWHSHTYWPHTPAPRLPTPLFHPSAPQGAQQELLSTTPR